MEAERGDLRFFTMEHGIAVLASKPSLQRVYQLSFGSGLAEAFWIDLLQNPQQLNFGEAQVLSQAELLKSFGTATYLFAISGRQTSKGLLFSSSKHFQLQFLAHSRQLKN